MTAKSQIWLQRAAACGVFSLGLATTHGQTLPVPRSFDARQEARARLDEALARRSPASTGLRAADLGLWLTYPPGTTGLTVSDVADSSVFAQVGVLEGDRIVLINGQPVTSEAQFVEILGSPSLAQEASITVARGAQRLSLLVPVSQLMQGIATRDPLYDSGLLVDDRDPNRLVVLRVFPRTPAYYAGLRTGDVLTTVNGQPIVSLNGFVQALDGGNVGLEVARNGLRRQLTIGIPDGPIRTALRPALPVDPPPGPIIQGVETVDPTSQRPLPAVTLPGFAPYPPPLPDARSSPTRPGIGTRPVFPIQPVAPSAVPGRPPLGSPRSSQGTVRPGIRGGANPPAGAGTGGGTGATAGGAGAVGGTGAADGGTGSTAGGAGAVGGTGAPVRNRGK